MHNIAYCLIGKGSGNAQRIYEGTLIAFHKPDHRVGL